MDRGEFCCRIEALLSPELIPEHFTKEITLMNPALVEKISRSIRPERLIETALALIEIPSPTRSAGAVAEARHAVPRGSGSRLREKDKLQSTNHKQLSTPNSQP